MNKYICIIPARKGSKRIKNKNIKSFFGKPIIFYSIKTSINSKIFNEVYVSTDSKKIQQISIKYGAKCDNLRKKKLAR
jgi:pseudaminic acid cytidylyltransferase